MVGFQGESPADRRALEGAASRSFRDVQAMFKRVRESEEESERAARASFKTVQLGPARGRLVESDCPYGAEPRPCPGLLGWNLSSVISLHFWEG